MPLSHVLSARVPRRVFSTWIRIFASGRLLSVTTTSYLHSISIRGRTEICFGCWNACTHTGGASQPASRRHRHRRRRCRLRAHDVNNRLLINCLTAQVELTMANLWFVTPPGGKPALLRGGCAGIAGVAACGSWRYVHRGVEGWNRGQRRRLGGWMGERGWCARMEEDERRTVVEDERRWRAGHPLST